MIFLFTILSANAFACSSFLDLDGAPTALGFESFRVTVRLKTKECSFEVSFVEGIIESLSTTKNPKRSNFKKKRKKRDRNYKRN